MRLFFIKNDVYNLVDLYTNCAHFCRLVHKVFTRCLQICIHVYKYVYTRSYHSVYVFVLNVYICVYFNVKFTYCLLFYTFISFLFTP